MTHQVRRNHVPTSVSLNSANIQWDVLTFFAILEPSFVACFVDMLEPIRVREFVSSNCLQRLFWTHRFPMNSTVRFLYVTITTAYQSHDQFRDFGFKSTSFEIVTGRNIIPLLFVNRKNIRMFFHWIRLNFQLLRMNSSLLHDTCISAEPASLFFAKDLSNPICSSNSELAGLWSDH